MIPECKGEVSIFRFDEADSFSISDNVGEFDFSCSQLAVITLQPEDSIRTSSYRWRNAFTIDIVPILCFLYPCPCFGFTVCLTQRERLLNTLFDVVYCFLLFDVLYYKRTNSVSISGEGAGDD